MECGGHSCIGSSGVDSGDQFRRRCQERRSQVIKECVEMVFIGLLVLEEYERRHHDGGEIKKVLYALGN